MEDNRLPNLKVPLIFVSVSRRIMLSPSCRIKNDFVSPHTVHFLLSKSTVSALSLLLNEGWLKVPRKVPVGLGSLTGCDCSIGCDCDCSIACDCDCSIASLLIGIFGL